MGYCCLLPDKLMELHMHLIFYTSYSTTLTNVYLHLNLHSWQLHNHDLENYCSIHLKFLANVCRYDKHLCQFSL